jgi:hypothetical protein
MRPVNIADAIKLRAGKQEALKAADPGRFEPAPLLIFSMPSATRVISRSEQQLMMERTIACFGPLRWILLTISRSILILSGWKRVSSESPA